MARFIYNGEPGRAGWVTSYGAPNTFIMPAVGPAVQYAGPFTVGQDMGYDFTDPTTLECMRGDDRFTEI